MDSRWSSLIPKLIKAKQERELTIHVRSVFLQGLLLTNDIVTWSKIWGAKSQLIISWLEQQREIYQCENVGVLAIKYVKSQPWVDALVLGADNLEQLHENILNITTLPLSLDNLNSIDFSRPSSINEQLLNPALW